MMYQYPQQPQPQPQYYAYPQYPAAYPQQPQPVHVAQPPPHPAPAPAPPPPPAPAPAPAPMPAPAPAPVAQPQPVAPVHNNHKTNAEVATEFAGDGLDCCARTLRITLMLFVTTGFVFSALATSSCSFMVYTSEPPPPNSSSGAQTQSQLNQPTSAPTTILSSSSAANTAALLVLQSVEANSSSSPADSNTTANVEYPPFSSPNNLDEIREDGDDYVRGRVLRPTISNRAGKNFEDLLPPTILEKLANTAYQVGVGINRYDPAKLGCRKYENKWFDSFFTTARIGALMATGGSALALFLLSVELICCRFVCSRFILVICLIGALIGQCMTFFTYGSAYCTDQTNAYNCDMGSGTIYSIVAVFMLLISAVLVCPTPKSKPFLRVLVEKERQKEEIVDPCFWCFAGMCAKKPEGEEEHDDDVEEPMCWCCIKQQAVAEPIENSNIGPESGHEASSSAAPPQSVGAPPPQPVPVFYSAYPPQPQSQPQAFPNEVQAQGGDAPSNLSQPPPPPLKPLPDNIRVREDAIPRSDSVSLPALPAGDDSVGGNRSVRSAYTNPEVYESDLFFDATPSVIEEEGDEVESTTEYGST